VVVVVVVVAAIVVVVCDVSVRYSTHTFTQPTPTTILTTDHHGSNGSTGMDGSHGSLVSTSVQGHSQEFAKGMGQKRGSEDGSLQVWFRDRGTE